MMNVADGTGTTTYPCCAQTASDAECAPHRCLSAQICPAPHAGTTSTAPGVSTPGARVSNITCIQEGWSSIIHLNGSQHMMPLFIRTDGNAEAAMGLAAAAVLLPNVSNTSRLEG